MVAKKHIVIVGGSLDARSSPCISSVHTHKYATQARTLAGGGAGSDPGKERAVLASLATDSGAPCLLNVISCLPAHDTELRIDPACWMESAVCQPRMQELSTKVALLAGHDELSASPGYRS